MINDAALTTNEEGFHTSDVTFGSYQVQEGRGHELNMKRQW